MRMGFLQIADFTAATTTYLYNMKTQATKALDEQLGSLIKPQVPEGILSKYLKFTGYSISEEFKAALQGMSDAEIRDSYNKINDALFWQSMKELRAINNPSSDPTNPKYYTEDELKQKAQDMYDIRNSLKLEHRIETSVLSKAGIALYNYWHYGKLTGPSFQDLYVKKGAIDTILSAFKTGGGDLGIKHNVAQEVIKMSNELTKMGLPTEVTAITETALEAYTNAKQLGSNVFDAWLASKEYLINDSATAHYKWLLSSEPPTENKNTSMHFSVKFPSISTFQYTNPKEDPLTRAEDRPTDIKDCFYMLDKLVFQALDSTQEPVKDSLEQIKYIRSFINDSIQDQELTTDANKFLNHLHSDYENIQQTITKEHLQEYIALRESSIWLLESKGADMHDQNLIVNALNKVVEGYAQEARDIINNELHCAISDTAFHGLSPAEG